MQLLFPRSPWRPQAAALARRVSALILMAALTAASQGCGVIADVPDRAVSTRAVLPPQARSGSPSINKPPAHTVPPEIPPIAKIPSAPESEPVIATIPAPSPPTETETGLASWYGPKFHGKLTASGEVFNQEIFTAAHRTLPWGCRVKVTNLANGKSVEVRINDRGPFVKGRIIDVSRAAARALGMVKSGTTAVRIEWVSDRETSNDLALENKQAP